MPSIENESPIGYGPIKNQAFVHSSINQAVNEVKFLLFINETPFSYTLTLYSFKKVFHFNLCFIVLFPCFVHTLLMPLSIPWCKHDMVHNKYTQRRFPVAIDTSQCTTIVEWCLWPWQEKLIAFDLGVFWSFYMIHLPLPIYY